MSVCVSVSFGVGMGVIVMMMVDVGFRFVQRAQALIKEGRADQDDGDSRCYSQPGD